MNEIVFHGGTHYGFKELNRIGYADVSKGPIRYNIGEVNARAGYAFYNWLDALTFDFARLWDEYSPARRKGQDPLRHSESYRAPREWEGYEEGDMPYNRRTGQWYPARRYGGSSYNRGYRRYGRRYSGGYSPRRRRTYGRW